MTDEKIIGEQLTEEQLDKVAGGNNYEINADSKFFQAMGTTIKESLATRNGTNELKRAWAKYGISLVFLYGYEDKHEDKNEYYYDGKQITRDDALKIVVEKSGKKIDPAAYHV